MALTREFLKQLIEGISDENITSIINESQKDTQKAQSDLQTKIQELQTVTTERDALKTQIGQRDSDIKSMHFYQKIKSISVIRLCDLCGN